MKREQAHKKPRDSHHNIKSCVSFFLFCVFALLAGFELGVLFRPEPLVVSYIFSFGELEVGSGLAGDRVDWIRGRIFAPLRVQAFEKKKIGRAHV